MTKKRLLGISVVVLLVLNITTITLLLMGPPHPGHGKKPKDVIVQKLDFDAEQIKAFEGLIDAHRTAVEAKHEENLGLKNALYASLSSNDENGRESLLNNFVANQREIERLHLNHFLDIKKLCKAEQLPKFQELTAELSKLFAPPRPPKK